MKKETYINKETLGSNIDGSRDDVFIIINPRLTLTSLEEEMLEALESIENDDGHIPDTIWQMRNAAIKKAKGEL